MTACASADEELIITVCETLGSVAGKVVASAKRTASSLSGEKDRLSSSLAEDKKSLDRVATKVRAKTRTAVKKGKKKAAKLQSSARKMAKSAKSAAASAKKSVKRAARRLKRR